MWYPGKPAHSGKSEAHSGSLCCEDGLISKGHEHNGVPWGLVSCTSGAAEVATVFTPERRVWFLVAWRRSRGMLKSSSNQTVQCSVSLGVMCSASGRSRAWQQSKLYPTVNGFVRLAGSKTTSFSLHEMQWNPLSPQNLLLEVLLKKNTQRTLVFVPMVTKWFHNLSPVCFRCR